MCHVNGCDNLTLNYMTSSNTSKRPLILIIIFDAKMYRVSNSHKQLDFF